MTVSVEVKRAGAAHFQYVTSVYFVSMVDVIVCEEDNGVLHQFTIEDGVEIDSGCDAIYRIVPQHLDRIIHESAL